MMLPPSLIHITLFQFENLEFMFSEDFQDLASLQRLSAQVIKDESGLRFPTYPLF
ncbi:hypothetical protein V6Z11_D05G416700 [Gossypium hirsutum]